MHSLNNFKTTSKRYVHKSLAYEKPHQRLNEMTKSF